QQGREWKQVSPKTMYGVQSNTFTAVEFMPVKTMALRIEVSLAPGETASIAEWRVGPEPAIAPAPDLAVAETLARDDVTLDWTVTLKNPGTRPIEIGDLAVPFAFAERAGGRGEIYTKKLLRHALVAGHGSWIYWERSNAVGPYLVMTPVG